MRLTNLRTTAFLTLFLFANNPLTCVADVVFDDGGLHFVKNLVNDFIRVSDSNLGVPTTVVFESGAIVNGTSGSDDSAFVTGRSFISIVDGIFEDDVSAYQSSILDIAGGQILDDVFASGDSFVSISGGVIADDLEAVDNSQVVMTGGTIGEDIEVSGGSIRILGGQFAASGIGRIGLGDGGLITLVGSNFSINGNSIGPGNVTEMSGFLSGTLADGSSFTNILFERNLGDPTMPGTLIIAPVPEPSTLLTMLAAVNFSLWIRRRR
ncbi:MAG: PEP-CTERM sorting domain-containing protein [Planctomycetota bacterium]